MSKHCIVFYNVENLYNIKDDPKVSDTEFTPWGDKRWDEHRYERKIDSLARIISAIHNPNPIIVGLTEVENRGVLKDLKNNTHLSHTKYKILHEDSPDNRGIDLCLLFDQDQVKYVSHNYLRINFPWNRDIKTRDILFFECLIEDQKFWIVVNHWPSRRSGTNETEKKRLHVAKAVRTKIDEILDNDINSNIIVMGDFNDEPINKSLTQVLKSKLSKNIDEREFYNLMVEADKREEGTSTHMGEWLMIDQMMINRNILHGKNGTMKVTGNKAGIFTKEDVLYCRPNGKCKPNQTYAGDHYLGGISDHLPIFITLEKD